MIVNLFAPQGLLGIDASLGQYASVTLGELIYLGLAEFRLRAFRARQGPRSQPAPPSAGDPVLLLEAD